MDLEEIRQAAHETVTARNLTYRQQLHRLAQIAEAALGYPKLSASAEDALADGLVCDLAEGNGPYRPRYVLPDYGKAMLQGCEFLELDAPTDIDDAFNFLSILYHHVPSITTYPVFLGDIDMLLLPFCDEVDDRGLHRRLTRFWKFLDRTIPDAFSHANIGPLDNRVARMILRVDRELAQVVPNLTLKYDATLSGEELLREACVSICAVNKPHVANHSMMAADHPHGYGVVSCYNTLPVGGGSHTLVRLNLAESLARHEGSADRYLEKTLPAHSELAFEVMRARIRFLVEESGFYEHNFLAREGLISLDRFTAMFGLFGLAELVEGLLPGARYGWDDEANDLAHRVVETCAGLVADAPMPHCLGGRAMLHSQSGISEDIGVTAGSRVATSREPETIEHILAVAPHHHHFAAGVSDIFALDITAKTNPEALVDITRGAFAHGMREMTYNVEGTDLVRVTGYMVRLSDIEKLRREGSRLNSTVLGAESVENWKLLERVPRVISHETNPWSGR